MKSLKGTKTAENLMKSFAGEAQARTRYTYYASTAKKEGYVQISNIFMETAENEKEHAKRFFKFLNEDFKGESIEIKEASYPVNLEHEEWSQLYSEFGKVAAEEGFPEISYVYEKIAEVEKHHEERYRKLLSNLENNSVFKKETVRRWKCNNCGYIYEGTSAPEKCPACAHPQGYFELLAENY
jgi:rubrerythrin